MNLESEYRTTIKPFSPCEFDELFPKNGFKSCEQALITLLGKGKIRNGEFFECFMHAGSNLDAKNLNNEMSDYLDKWNEFTQGEESYWLNFLEGEITEILTCGIQNWKTEVESIKRKTFGRKLELWDPINNTLVENFVTESQDGFKIPFDKIDYNISLLSRQILIAPTGFTRNNPDKFSKLIEELKKTDQEFYSFTEEDYLAEEKQSKYRQVYSWSNRIPVNSILL